MKQHVIKCKLFLPWYSSNIAYFGVKQSLTQLHIKYFPTFFYLHKSQNFKSASKAHFTVIFILIFYTVLSFYYTSRNFNHIVKRNWYVYHNWEYYLWLIFLKSLEKVVNREVSLFYSLTFCVYNKYGVYLSSNNKLIFVCVFSNIIALC